MVWTLEREKKLRELWNNGYTAMKIATMLGDATRNSVIGKAHRLKLAARAPTKESTTKTRSQKNPNQVLKTEKLSRKARFKSLLLDKNFEPENPKKLEELNDTTCRWPIGHPDEKDFYFCGRSPVKGFSYCKLHVLYSYQPKNAKEEDIIGSEDIPEFIGKKIKSA